ncbi:4Fe-4S binding protein [Cryptosporangium aurantiacum]|uniref:4Fe-4S dicluster domain-containing protein n=1 Tax=Cryptosporangium aurantiacum TaxID=134849 RepID=A0A1M7PET4_9ACTN|nr:4Fe-4S binding protein [Cryptosporangium aurantiacum]SHN15503.1 4Fe-4S dicluster domain-containing protein [Cryptosporangium aurantiacum]
MKLVKQAIEVIEDNCTGCYRCERACPTAAITMVGPRREALAVVDNDSCISCFRCIDVCPDDAMLAVERDEPRKVGTSARSVDPTELNALCEKAGLDPGQMGCLCSSTKIREMAAAVLRGASTFEELALATGAASGCLLYCGVPMQRVLRAHLGDRLDESGSKVRRYDSTQVLLEIDEAAADAYPLFALRREQAAARAKQEEKR